MALQGRSNVQTKWGRPGKGQAHTPMGASLWWSCVTSCCAWLSPMGWYLLIFFFGAMSNYCYCSIFNTMSEKFQVATKMLAQWGKNKAAQESAACWFRGSELLNLKLEGLFLANSYFCNLKIRFVLCPLYSTVPEPSEFLTDNFLVIFGDFWPDFGGLSSCPDKFHESPKACQKIWTNLGESGDLRPNKSVQLLERP